MKKRQVTEPTKTKRFIIATLMPVLLMGLSIGILYVNSQRGTPTQPSRCEGVHYSTSADDVAVVNEADLNCLGEIYKSQNTIQTKLIIENGTLITGVTAFLASIILLVYIYRKV